MKKSRKLISLLVFVITMGVLISVCVIVDRILLKTDCSDPMAVNQAFAAALINNNAEQARSFTAPEQWDRIDAWISEHEVFDCSFSWNTSLDPDNNEIRVICAPGSSSWDKTSLVHCNYGLHSVCANGIYRFWISDIQMIKTEQGWQVTDWGEIGERIDGENTKCD